MKTVFKAIALLAVVAQAAAPLASFRPPAIPLITRDPFTQIYVRNDTATPDWEEGTVYWDGEPRSMLGLLRIDGVAYRFLGSATTANPVPDPTPNVIEHLGKDIATATCDVANYENCKDADTCNSYCYGNAECRAYVFVAKDRKCFLKSCTGPLYDSDTHDGYVLKGSYEGPFDGDVAPGICDVANYENLTADECAAKCYDAAGCDVFVIDSETNKCYLKSCKSPVISSSTKKHYTLNGMHAPVPEQPAALKQTGIMVYPTRTIINLELAGKLAITVTYLQTMFADNMKYLGRPVSYVTLDISSLDGAAHDVQLYLDATSEHISNYRTNRIQWGQWETSAARAAYIGTEDQAVLGEEGDHFGINWGFLHLGGPETATVTEGSMQALRDHFIANGKLPAFPTDKNWKSWGLPTVAVAQSVSVPASGSARGLFTYTLDDVATVYYYGQSLKPSWTHYWASVEDMVTEATKDYETVLAYSVSHDKKILDDLSAAGGDEYATVSGLAYRQTLAATKLVWNDKINAEELYLKEISSNGDLQTADVIYPACPVFLYANPDLLRMLLDPLLRFANNETWIPYTHPYSPHELGVWPIGNHTTAQQEDMPMENTANLFMMFLAIIQRNGGDVSFLYPHYWPMLVNWADYLNKTLPYPASQLCTDDFMGHTNNNTNLAAKGIISLQAFGEICKLATGDEADCQRYIDWARIHAETWLRDAATEDGGMPHTRLSYNDASTWSTKYNLIWQRILRFGNSPFTNYDELLRNEIAWYLTKEKTYGIQMDSRNSDWTKLDWYSWSAFMSPDEEIGAKMLAKVYAYAHETEARCPLGDLYHCNTGKALYVRAFVARPVNGALFAKLLL